jgi:hypothetical protein
VSLDERLGKPLIVREGLVSKKNLLFGGIGVILKMVFYPEKFTNHMIVLLNILYICELSCFNFGVNFSGLFLVQVIAWNTPHFDCEKRIYWIILASMLLINSQARI